MSLKFLIQIALLSILIKSSFSRVWCDNDQTCHENISTYYTCNISENVCEHNTLFDLTKRYIIGGILIIFISAFANAGGIGGGSVIVPVLTIMFAYEVNEAIPLSKATIFAGAVINVFFLLNARKVENPNQSLIDYKLCAFMLPIMMCGTFLGVYLNFIFPPMIIIVLLTGYLLLSIFSLKKKFQILSDKEDQELGITLKEQMIGTYKECKDKVSRKFNSIFNRNSPANDEEIMENLDRNEINVYPVQVEGNPRERNNKNSAPTTASTRDTESNSQRVDSEDTKLPDQVPDSLFGPRPGRGRRVKSFGEMICDNIIFIMILLMSIFMIVFLSLFKEGILFDLGVKINRCSLLGFSIMGIIMIFCITVTSIAYTFNIKKEKRDLNQSIITGENIPVKVQNDLNVLKQQQEAQERELSEIQRQHDDSGETDYLSFQGDKEAFDNENHSIQDKGNQQGTELTLSIDKYMKKSVQNSKKTRSDDLHSVRSEISIQSIIDDNMQEKKKTLVKLGAMSFVAGTGAGLLGIGGGMIINPFLIILNYSPLDSMAISSMGVLFTSTISTSEFLIMKAIQFSDLVYFLGLAGIGSLTGVFVIKSLIESYRRQSILLIIILGIFIFAVIVLPLFGLLTISPSKYFAFGSVCD